MLGGGGPGRRRGCGRRRRRPSCTSAEVGRVRDAWRCIGGQDGSGCARATARRRRVAIDKVVGRRTCDRDNPLAEAGGWMTVFVCAGCDAAVSSRLAQVALPVHARQKWGNELLPVLMEPGTYAVDLEPSGPPWRPGSEIGEDDAAARGVFAPEHALSFGPPGAIVIAPGDARGTVLIPDRCGGCCCGLDGRDGPNLACAQCGQPVATRIDDCSLWQAVWFAPNAVRALPDNQPTGWTSGWEWQKWPAVPPVAPDGSWNPRWAAAVGAGLAHLLAASEGTPVALPNGPITDTFAHALDALLPLGRRRRPWRWRGRAFRPGNPRAASCSCRSTHRRGRGGSPPPPLKPFPCPLVHGSNWPLLANRFCSR